MIRIEPPDYQPPEHDGNVSLWLKGWVIVCVLITTFAVIWWGFL